MKLDGGEIVYVEEHPFPAPTRAEHDCDATRLLRKMEWMHYDMDARQCPCCAALEPATATEWHRRANYKIGHFGDCELARVVEGAA